MQTYATDRLRNVVLLSHSGAGKTSLTESLLLASGAITRLGRVEEGNTTSDFEPEAIERRQSIQLALAPCVWRDVKINVLDTPGHADYAGEASLLDAAKAGKGVLEAAHTGVFSGNPVVDMKVTLTDGSYHAVDSSGKAFHIAAARRSA